MSSRKFYIILSFFLATVFTYGQETIVLDQRSGCDTLSVQFILDTPFQLDDYSRLEWQFGDGTTALNSLALMHTYTQPGVYLVKCVLNNSRTIVATDTISLGQTPFVDFSFRDSTETGTLLSYLFMPEYFISAEGIDLDYTWTFHDGSIEKGSTALFIYDEEGIYELKLKIEDAVGCADSLTKLVPVSKELMVPNVFSPNGDDINDYFEVTTPGDYIYHFRVFSRTGTQVHYARSPLIVWDGRTIGGMEVPEGVYYYVIEGENTPLETRISGFVHLYR